EHTHGVSVAEGYSFPSGHSSSSMVAYGMLAYLAVRLLPARWHLPALLAAASVVFTVGWSRVVLQVHYASDVLAGWVTGGTWLVCCVLVTNGVGHWQRSRAGAAA
ncbi:phosphatase PAP2 family protein, partial [Paracidovorax citrulli]